MPVRLAIMAFMLCVLVPSSASAHAVLIKSDPADTSTQKEVPETIQMEFTETVDVFQAQVLDGCGRNVLESADTGGVNITLVLGPAQPGKFKVRYNLVSGDDGHRSDGRIAFRVRGSKDCSVDESPSDGPQAEGLDLVVNDTPWLLIGGITALFILVAVAIRRRGGTRS